MATQKGARAASRAIAIACLAASVGASGFLPTRSAQAEDFFAEPEPIVVAAAPLDLDLRPTLDTPFFREPEPGPAIRTPRPDDLTMFSMADVLRQRRPRAAALPEQTKAHRDLTANAPLNLRGTLSDDDEIGIAGEFGSRAVRVARTRGSSDWDRVQQRLEEEAPALTACANRREACTTTALKHWHDIVESARGRDDIAKARIVNRLINDGWRYRTDEDVYGVPDYWATPAEFLAKGGDCEDFAIVKWWTLKVLGVDTDRMRIIVVRDNERRQYHAVLAVAIDGRSTILDNLYPLAYDAAERHTYTALASFGTGGTFVHQAARLASR